MFRLRTRWWFPALVAGVLVAGCAAPARDPWPTAAPTASPTESPSPALPDGSFAIALSPVPVELILGPDEAESAWVAPLTGEYIDALAPEAAAQVQYRDGTETEYMAANVLWFTLERFTALMATPDAPKGIEIGMTDSHVLFVQPALDMPFDPATADAARYSAIVEQARRFTAYRMRDASITLLRPCPTPGDWPRTPVTSQVRAVLEAYFAEKGLTPISFIGDASVLDVEEQSLGEHRCANAGGPGGGYVGAVPIGSTEAVMVYVKHKPYPVTGAPSTFVTLAKDATGTWSVVGEGTGP